MEKWVRILAKIWIKNEGQEKFKGQRPYFGKEEFGREDGVAEVGRGCYEVWWVYVFIFRLDSIARSEAKGRRAW